MDWLNWYDLLAPTNPYASLLFGFIITLVVGVAVMLETKQKRIGVMAVITGVLTTVIGVAFLTWMGLY
ncbi:hypothetical protein [Bacillus sp. KH172YL63]|uniref:hypothetical protein n=1 Tax=Bacillus sp. KH172YL63 TaxID=2709784 RepID=UPI0013E4BCEE|nr:hypothetical protein [Bacillus sp. KH172YL63]BCB03727.1 hypothetical protein KH172YL63_18600 [Bacillus sp. KH172YL63]